VIDILSHSIYRSRTYVHTNTHKVLRYTGCISFRSRLICAALSGKPVCISNIRSSDSRAPGLKGPYVCVCAYVCMCVCVCAHIVIFPYNNCKSLPFSDCLSMMVYIILCVLLVYTISYALTGSSICVRVCVTVCACVCDRNAHVSLWYLYYYMLK